MTALAVTALVEALLYLSHHNKQRAAQRISRDERIMQYRKANKLGGRNA